MADKPLSLPATCALLILMAEAREVSNPELEEKYGITITGKERTALNDRKLVDSWKTGRSFTHTLTDSGWAHVAELFHDGLPIPKSGSPGAALRALVIGLQRHLHRSDGRLAEIFAQDEDVIHPIPPDEITPSVPEVVSSSAPDVEGLIRTAYEKLAAEPGAWVSLTRLRPLLGDAPRTEVDDTLRRMIGMPGVHIVPESNQKMLTDDDRNAAVTIGDQAKHLILIGAR
ncbi:hypothetical protein [Microbispora sp. NPDC049125]|uniref:hypothetical protein n=1 Tax=Microbispora sp. NPDC049125 TaxID=3154929 RepID=UPI0034653F58